MMKLLSPKYPSIPENEYAMLTLARRRDIAVFKRTRQGNVAERPGKGRTRIVPLRVNRETEVITRVLVTR